MSRARMVLALLLACAGCRETLPTYTVSVPPRAFDEQPPSSVVFARTRVSLAVLEQALAGAVPPTMEGEARRGGFLLRWSLARRTSTVHGDPRGLRVEVGQVGALEVAAGPLHCRAAEAAFSVVAIARPLLAPDGALQLADVQLQPTLPGSLNCNGLSVPLGSLLAQLIEPLGAQLASVLEHLRLPLGGLVDQVLDALAAPHPLELAGAPACLALEPRALVIAPVAGAGTSLELAVGVEVAPRVLAAACPAAAARLRGPVRVREAALGAQFGVDLLLTVPASELEQRLARALVGRRFGGRRSIVVRAVQVGDASGRLLVRLDVRGAIDGALYLWGTPRVVARDGRLVVEAPDLRAAAETRSLTTRLALWLWEQRDGGLEAEARKHSRFDVTDPVAAARRALSRTFRAPASPLALAVSIDRIEPVGVSSRPGALTAYARLAGRATLEP